jgi:hypothetical protein
MPVSSNPSSGRERSLRSREPIRAEIGNRADEGGGAAEGVDHPPVPRLSYSDGSVLTIETTPPEVCGGRAHEIRHRLASPGLPSMVRALPL